MAVVKRQYRSRVRTAKAAATRRRIVNAARRLFARGGVAGASVESIARRARVSPQTVYLTFGSKIALASAVIDEAERGAGLQSLIDVIAADRAPRDQIREIARFNKTLFGEASDVIDSVRAAGQSDSELASVYIDGEKRRRGGTTRLVEGWQARGALRSGMSVTHATDLLWMLTSPDVYRLLVRDCGWSPDRYEEWLQRSIAEWLLLAR